MRKTARAPTPPSTLQQLEAAAAMKELFDAARAEPEVAEQLRSGLPPVLLGLEASEFEDAYENILVSSQSGEGAEYMHMPPPLAQQLRDEAEGCPAKERRGLMERQLGVLMQYLGGAMGECSGEGECAEGSGSDDEEPAGASSAAEDAADAAALEELEQLEEAGREQPWEELEESLEGLAANPNERALLEMLPRCGNSSPPSLSFSDSLLPHTAPQPPHRTPQFGSRAA